MKNCKRLLAAVLAVVLCLGMSACGFHVGTSTKSEDYKELFPDRAAALGSSYKTSNLAYNYSLDGYGSMQVYVDTSEGHSFELDETYGGFSIKDKDGNEVFHTYPLPKDEYANMTSYVDEVKTINGRQFFYSLDQLYTHCYTYFADCGIDCGMLFETDQDESVFSLVAFRGTPIDGASSDPYTYKGESADMSVETEDDLNMDDTVDDDIAGDDAADSSDEKGSLTTTTLSSDVESALNSLDTDYSNIYWGVKYSLDSEMPGLVVSVTPFTEYDQNALLLAFTNMYDQPLGITGTAKALSKDGEEIGDTFIYTDAIGPANTVIAKINCGDEVPDGRVRWEDVKIDTEPNGKYVPWECDWSVTGNPDDSYITINYEFYSANNEPMKLGEVHYVLLDESGFVLVDEMDFVSDETPAGEKYTGSEDIYADPEILKAVKGIAIFASSN